MKKTPEISVIMSVYNAEPFLAEAIESILGQSFSDFEFIITNDASTDGSLEILSNYSKKDDRIILLRNLENRGLAANLNRMIEIAEGKYIARMDADDISLPERLQKQYDFMENNPGIGVSGAQIIPFGSKKFKMDPAPVTHEEIKASLFFTNPMMHPTVMFRKSVLEETSARYDENLRTSQDLDLWFSLIRKTKFANCSEPMLRYRIEGSGASFIANYAGNSKAELLSRILKKGILSSFPEFTKLNLNVLCNLSNGFAKSVTDLDSTNNVIEEIIKLNAQKKIFNDKYFMYFLSKQFFRFCTNSTHLGIKVFAYYKSSPYRKFYNPGLNLKNRLLIKSIVKFKSHGNK
ncbi:MAG: glycosyltransferase family 2 protein [Candidatus Delongbacteria bacterium]|nr:glycosyltransferase family 2 protein [Candidatus Delongbacteria bacterium]